MTKNEMRIAINIRVGNALLELEKDDFDPSLVRDMLCDAAQFTHFKEDGSRDDVLNPSDVVMQNYMAELTRKDIEILNGSSDSAVREDEEEDAQVKYLYNIYRSL